MKRRWDCASSASYIAVSDALNLASIQGEITGRGRAFVSWKIRRHTILCIQVVPHLDAVAMTTSPGLGL
jgi:hypothetical protein